MWVIGSIFYLVPVAAIAIRLLSPQSHRVTPLGVTDTAKILRPGIAFRPVQRFDLLRLPLIGRLLRARYGRMALQSVAFVIAVMVIADGFMGHPMGAMNLAGVLPWTYVRAFGVIALLVLGNIFCLSCPFMLPRELGHRLGLARLKWPRGLRSKWLAIALMILFFWSYEAFAIWDHPGRTAWLLIAYFAAAFVVDTFFRGASFCKYVCPLGQFNFAGSLLSPFTLAVRSPAACERCTTHDCIQGNQQQRGCELQLYMPQKAGNMDCTLCMDCVKACPHDNIGLFAVPPVRDVLRDPVRSSIGRFSSRIDIAVLALVVVFGAFANAGLMVGPVAARLSALGDSLANAVPLPLLGLVAVLVFSAAIVAVLLVLDLAGLWLSRSGERANPSRREVFCRFSQALLPLGLAMWVAHLLFHLFTGWATLGPAIHQAGADFGWHLLAPPQWGMNLPLLSANTMLSAQLLLLDAGLLLTLYLGWRLAQHWTARSSRAILLLLPWATSVAVAYAVGVWILLQPMQMRGVMMNP
jgi:polyferredoxin